MRRDTSLRQLHRLLCQHNLYKRYHKNKVNVVLKATKVGVDRPSTNLGYGSIHQKLRHNGIKSDRETVRLCLKTIDSEGLKGKNLTNLKDKCMYLRDQTSCGI